MTKELEQKLFVSHGDLFIPDEKNELHFQCECNDGWFSLIDFTLGELATIGNDIKVFSIKEKFGKLRLDIENATPEAEELLQTVETISSTVCEYCGNDSKLRLVNGWSSTICDPCKEELKKNLDISKE